MIRLGSVLFKKSIFVLTFLIWLGALEGTEVCVETSDGSSYQRSLMHADGNIRYVNYQSEEQMSNYLPNNDYESSISDIIA